MAVAVGWLSAKCRYRASTRVRIAVLGWSAFESAVHPVVLIWRLSNLIFQEPVYPSRICSRVIAGKVLESGQDIHDIAGSVFQTAGQAWNDRSSADACDLTRCRAGHSGLAEERRDDAVFAAVGLIRRIPDDDVAAQGTHQLTDPVFGDQVGS